MTQVNTKHNTVTDRLPLVNEFICNVKIIIKAEKSKAALIRITIEESIKTDDATNVQPMQM